MVDRSGKTITPETEIWFPDAYSVEINGVSADTSGRLYAALEVWARGGLVTGVVCRLDVGGKEILAIRTGDFIPRVVAATTAGDVWVFGSPALLRTEKRSTLEYDTLWHFDNSGRLVEKLLPRSTFGESVIPSHAFGDYGFPVMWTTSSRLGLFSPTANRWLELDLRTGRKIVDLTPAWPRATDGQTPVLAELAMTDSDNGVYAYWFYRQADSQHAQAIYNLNRTKGTWDLFYQAPLSSEYQGFFGADGDDLIFRAGTKSFGWFPASSLAPSGNGKSR